MSFIKHSLIVFLLLNVVRERVCDVEANYSMVSIAEEQPDLGRSDIDLLNLLAVAAKDADGNINLGKDNIIAGKTNTVQGSGNSILGENNVVTGNNNNVASLTPKNLDVNKKYEDNYRISSEVNSISDTKPAVQKRRRRDVIGANNEVSGIGNTVRGNNNIVRGNNNYVIGNNNIVPGQRNTAKGNNNELYGDNNDITGNNNVIRINNVIHIGNNFVV